MARLKQIELNADGNPEFITVHLSVVEAALIAKITGAQSPATAEEVMAGGGEASDGLYHAIADDLFNRFWDGGVEEYLDQR
jgi:hypothetical protein